MNRSPRPAVSSNSLRARYTSAPSPKPPVSPGNSRLTVPATPSARQTSPSPRKRITEKKPVEESPEPPASKLSLKEQIALKRAEAKKAAQATRNAPSGELAEFGVDDDPMPLKTKNIEEDVDSMGRWSVRETIERARSSGIDCRILCIYGHTQDMRHYTRESQLIISFYRLPAILSI